jgi:uncharacterized protein YmfQ (DUF2313 family)
VSVHGDLLLRLLPPTSYDPGGAQVSAELHAEGAALDAAEGRALALVDEADVRSAADLLLDWERVAGLPDTCTVTASAAPTPGQRRDALLARITGQGGQTREYFVALAAGLGFDISISEPAPHDVADDVEHPVYDERWRFAWYVHTAAVTVRAFGSDDTVDDPLAVWGNTPLECVIRRFKPAHTAVLFAYA